ncbi:MAG: hypothetical protein LBL82_07535 [Oscillospiraceae bacterium]|jgi:Gpi18-like mannosyltransferase|nr:hypothetical protein [Oscillospiraceae bacterium]
MSDSSTPKIKSHQKTQYFELTAAVVIFAFTLRIAIGMGYLNNFDTSWNLMWAGDLQNGFFNAYTHVRQLDYPPLYLYLLKIVGMFTANTDINNFDPYRMLAIKFFPILIDSLTCFVLFKAGSRKSGAAGFILAVLWAVNPAAIYNCAFWGQTDCVMIFALLLTFYLLSKGTIDETAPRETILGFDKKLLPAAIAFGLCMSLKFQCAYFAPIVFLEFIRRSGGFRRKQAYLRAILLTGASIAAFILAWLPFMIGAKSPLLPAVIYLEGAGTYPYITLHADNIYGLFNLNWVPEPTYLSVISTALTAASLFALVFVYVKFPRVNMYFAAALFMNCIFMLTTRQHERYQITIMIFLLMAYFSMKNAKLLLIYVTQSVVILINQARLLSRIHGNTIESEAVIQSVNSLINTALFAGMIIVFVIHTIHTAREGKADGQLCTENGSHALHEA